MVKGVGDDEGLEEMKDVVVEMPKHTKRRETFAGSPHFDSPKDKDFSRAKAARKQLFAAIPEQGDVNAPTPHGRESGPPTVTRAPLGKLTGVFLDLYYYAIMSAHSASQKSQSEVVKY